MYIRQSFSLYLMSKIRNNTFQLWKDRRFSENISWFRKFISLILFMNIIFCFIEKRKKNNYLFSSNFLLSFWFRIMRNISRTMVTNLKLVHLNQLSLLIKDHEINFYKHLKNCRTTIKIKINMFQPCLKSMESLI